MGVFFHRMSLHFQVLDRLTDRTMGLLSDMSTFWNPSLSGCIISHLRQELEARFVVRMLVL